MSVVDHIIEAVKRWSQDPASKLPGLPYLFGSTVHLPDLQFVRELSDVDILLVINGPESAELRLSHLQIVRRAAQALELHLLPILKPTLTHRTLASIVPVWTNEIELGICKAGGVAFFADTPVLDLTTGQVTRLSRSIPQFDRNLDFAIEVARECSAFRNRYVKVNVLGEYALQGYDGEPLPKELARAAARIAYYRNIGESIAPLDVNRGCLFLNELLAARRAESWAEPIIDLVTARLNRGQAVLDADTHVALYELLLDDALQVLQSSHASAESALPSPSGDTATRAVAAARHFYECIAARRLDTAWQLLTVSFQERVWGRDFERFKDGYVNFRGLSSISVFGPRFQSDDRCELSVFYEDRTNLPHLPALAQLRRAQMGRIPEISALVESLAKDVSNSEEAHARFITLELAKLMQPGSEDYVRWRLGLSAAAFAKIFPQSEEQILPRLYRCTLIRSGSEWKLDGTRPIRC